MDPFIPLALIMTACIVCAYRMGFHSGRAARDSDRPNLGSDVGTAMKAAVESANAQLTTIQQQMAETLNPKVPEDFVAPVAIGERFVYLGVRMLCTGHMVPRHIGLVPGVFAEYIAFDGVVRQWAFAATELDALRVEIARVPVLTEGVTS